jgi:hypothetical protein
MIANLKHERMGAQDVRIDRQTEWGNPFVVGRHGTREEVIARFERHMRARVAEHPELGDRLRQLHGKRLFCWCAPLPCHGDVLVRMAAELVEG